MYPSWTQHSQSSQCTPKAFYSFKNRCLFTVSFLLMHCNYTYIHSGDTPLICVSTWANGFKTCLLVCVANTCYWSGSQFAAGAPTSPYAQHWSWTGKEGVVPVCSLQWRVSHRAAPCVAQWRLREVVAPFSLVCLMRPTYLRVGCWLQKASRLAAVGGLLFTLGIWN